MDRRDYEVLTNNRIQKEAKENKLNMNNISDGYHTFGELYEHRIHLFIALCKFYNIEKRSNNEMLVTKSKLHDDGSEFEGWFIMQLETEEGQISYHLPNKYWDKTTFAFPLDKANKWDGHTSDDVLERLLKI